MTTALILIAATLALASGRLRSRILFLVAWVLMFAAMKGF